MIFITLFDHYDVNYRRAQIYYGTVRSSKNSNQTHTRERDANRYGRPPTHSATKRKTQHVNNTSRPLLRWFVHSPSVCSVSQTDRIVDRRPKKHCLDDRPFGARTEREEPTGHMMGIWHAVRRRGHSSRVLLACARNEMPKSFIIGGTIDVRAPKRGGQRHGQNILDEHEKHSQHEVHSMATFPQRCRCRLVDSVLIESLQWQHTHTQTYRKPVTPGLRLINYHSPNVCVFVLESVYISMDYEWISQIAL